MTPSVAHVDLLSTDLHWCLVRVARGIGAAEHEVLKPLNLSLYGYVVLADLVAGPPRNQLALSRASMIDKSTIVKVLDDLEQGGFVTRQVDPNDRRARIVEATTSGRELLRVAAERIGQFEAELLQPFSTRDRSTLRKVVRALALGPFAATFDPTSPAV